MDILRHFQNIAWCKPDWCYPSMSKETNELLRQCVDLPQIQLSDDIEEIIKQSKSFPIPFPINSVRLEELKAYKSLDKLKRNIVSTYPLIHERVLLLMTHFLIYKREFGSNIEKTFYKDMSVPDLIERILKIRAISFLGPHDRYQLITGETGSEGWEAVGTLQQKPPLVLENCLSYDEMKLSAMLYVSGYTCCINDGRRSNSGVVEENGVEEEAIIIGLIGPRFQRRFRMDNEDILITEQQNCLDNGYGEEVTPTTCLNVLKTTYVRNNQSAKHMWRQMWSEFYQVHSYTYEELSSYITIQDKDKSYMERYVKKPNSEDIFDNEVYYKRICILAETTLLEAEYRASECGKNAFINVIGCGLGVWMISPHQPDVYILTFLERIRAFLKKDLLNHVTDVNFAYIKASPSINALFTNSEQNDSPVEKRIFFESKRHPNGKYYLTAKAFTAEVHNIIIFRDELPWSRGTWNHHTVTTSEDDEHKLRRNVRIYKFLWTTATQPGKCGINIQVLDREPSCLLSGEHAGKLLVMTYPWDGNAHPGNEFWLKKLTSSGDPAAACSTQVSELHNAYINPAVSVQNLRVAGRNGIKPLAEYCLALASE